MNVRTTGSETAMELGMLDPVDLEQLRVRARAVAAAIARAGGPLPTEVKTLLADDLPALLAELAAARPVVSEARALDDDRLDETDTLARLSLAVAAYDRIVER
jgi:enoyl-CoA hydratase/carnithine racemase